LFMRTFVVVTITVTWRLANPLAAYAMPLGKK